MAKSNAQSMVDFLKKKVEMLEKENYDLKMKVAELNARSQPRGINSR